MLFNYVAKKKKIKLFYFYIRNNDTGYCARGNFIYYKMEIIFINFFKCCYLFFI